jgi:mannitol-specific phosphotransferase system IIBC component
MADATRYQVQIGNLLTEGFDATSEEQAEAKIADICISRESISSLPPDTEIIVTLPDGTSRTTTLVGIGRGMANATRYQVQIGNLLTEGFDATNEEQAEAKIADICISRESISSLPPDTEIIVTLPDGTSRTTTLELSKRLR